MGAGDRVPDDNPVTLGFLARIAGLTISVIAVAIVISEVDLAATRAVLSRADLQPLGLAMVALVAQLGSLAYRWRLLLPVRIDGERVPYQAVTEALLVGNLANAVLPGRLGEVVRALAISRRGSVDAAESVGVVVLERLLDLSMLAAVGLVAAYVAGAPAVLIQPLALVAVASLALIGVVESGIAVRLVDRLNTRFVADRAAGRWATIAGWITRIVDGLHAGQRPSVIVIALGATLASVLLDGVIFWAVGRSLGVGLDWAQALLMGTVGILVTGIPSAPANIGTFELAVAWVGVAVGVPIEAGLAVALVAHVIIVLPPSLGGAVVLLLTLRAGSSIAEPDPAPATSLDGQ